MTDINKLKELAERYIANPSGAGGEDSAFRAAANPQAILKLIAEVDLLSARLKAENCAHKDTQKHCELLEQYLKECASALPGTYYMDPPDGGNVSIPEQIRRGLSVLIPVPLHLHPVNPGRDWAVATMGPTTRRRRRAEAGSSA
ncbi:hypothetical protein [Pseudomonas aeruginosa]|uniref:hypothetical protein n=1 Tax=Pseudomonas aeruginosa TaxID=287 RepID=UPI0029347A22|nr:hypothetical protein [Pseudomonas aeruginosa]